MKKQLIFKILLVLLGVLAVSIAMGGKSVVLIDPAAGTTEAFSYFEPVADSDLSMAAPLAGICTVIAGGCAIIYLAARNLIALHVVRWTAFFGSCLAVLPILVKNDVVMIPNVAVPLLLFIIFLLASFMIAEHKKGEVNQEGRRLEDH